MPKRAGKGAAMVQLIDTRFVNESVDLLALAGRFTELRKKANTGGGEYSGCCPFCGGTDRFSVQPYSHIWMCRNCTPKWQDAIAFGRRLWPDASFEQVCKNLNGGELQPGALKNAGDHTPNDPANRATPPYTAPDLEWQAKARELVDEYADRLWSGEGEWALAYLRHRGLTHETIRHFRLGYRPTPRGISIPCFESGDLWYVKFRQLNSAGAKYICLPGSKPAALYNADAIISGCGALAVEGEFDTMLAHQHFGDFLPTFTPGSATNHIDLATWGRYLIRPSFTLILPDNDSAGRAMLETLSAICNNPIAVALPDADYKDLTEFYHGGGDPAAWAMDLLREYDPIPDNLAEFAASLGGKAQKTGKNPRFSLDTDKQAHKGVSMEK